MISRVSTGASRDTVQPDKAVTLRKMVNRRYNSFFKMGPRGNKLAVCSRQLAVSAYCELPTANQTKSGLQPGKLSAAFALLGIYVNIRIYIYRIIRSFSE